MSGYARLFTSILRSSIWRESPTTKVVWITMIALADRDSIVEGSIPGLASEAGVSVEECEKALEYLQAPDKYSRTKDDDGRRIREVDGGWFIINHSKYRDLFNKEEKREADRDRMRDKRSGSSNLVASSREWSHVVAPLNSSSQLKALTNADAVDEVGKVDEVGVEAAEGVDGVTLQELYDEWYDRGGPAKKDGTPYKENFEKLEKAFRRKGAKLEEFALKVRLRLDRFDLDDRSDRSFKLGMLRTFLDGNWRDEKGPPKSVAPRGKKNQVADPNMTLDLKEL